ncbi:hypothetical protein D3C76_1641830 [compost metagenome]
MGPRQPGSPAPFLGLTLPGHRQIAVDGKGAMQLLGNLGIERGLDAVPVEERDDQDQHGQQDNKAGKAPGEDFRGARHAQGS